MNPHDIHLALLDALVAGEDGPDLDSAWEWILSSPRSAPAWEETVARQRRQRALGFAVQGRPWLARVAARVLAVRRVATAHPPFELLVERAATGAMLGPPPVDEDLDVALTLDWGRLSLARIENGTVVELRASGSSEATSFFFQTSTETGSLPNRRWKLEPAEAPVLLLACLGATKAGTLDEAVAGANAIAGVVLTERATTPEPE